MARAMVPGGPSDTCESARQPATSSQIPQSLGKLKFDELRRPDQLARRPGPSLRGDLDIAEVAGQDAGHRTAASLGVSPSLRIGQRAPTTTVGLTNSVSSGRMGRDVARQP